MRLGAHALVPGSMLPLASAWRRLADAQPSGSVLFVVPVHETPLKRSMRRVATSLRAQGQLVSAISTDQLDHHRSDALTIHGTPTSVSGSTTTLNAAKEKLLPVRRAS